MNKNEKKILSQALGLITEAKEAVEALREAREQYADERSEKWADSEKGEAYMEESGEIEELLYTIEEAEEKFGEFDLD